MDNLSNVRELSKQGNIKAIAALIKDDYLMLKTMMQEYEKLKRGDYFADEYE